MSVDDTLEFLSALRAEHIFHPIVHYPVFSRRVSKNARIESNDNHVYFLCDPMPYLSFGVNNLQIDGLEKNYEHVFWQGAAQKEKTALIKGLYTPNFIFNRGKGTFRGSVICDDMTLDVVVKDNKLVTLANNKQIAERRKYTAGFVTEFIGEYLKENKL